MSDSSPHEGGRLLPAHDTALFVVERGDPDALPVLLLHGGPGLDHHEFGDYLDPLAETGRYRLVLVDQRGQGSSAAGTRPETWTLEQMASDVSAVAAGLGAERYAVLGHSFGAFVALQHAVDAPGAAVATVVSGGLPSSRFLAGLEQALATFEPVELREQVQRSWAAEANVETQEQVGELLAAQLPFHFADPRDPRIADYHRRTAGAVYAPEVLRHFASGDYGGIEVEDRLGAVRQPLLACTGRHDRVCPPAAAEAIAAGVPRGEVVIFEQSGHMSYVEENERYLAVVLNFLDRATSAG